MVTTIQMIMELTNHPHLLAHQQTQTDQVEIEILLHQVQLQHLQGLLTDLTAVAEQIEILHHQGQHLQRQQELVDLQVEAEVPVDQQVKVAEALAVV